MAKTKFKDIDELIDFIFSQWDKAGLKLSNRYRTSAKKSINAINALSDNVIEGINTAIDSYIPEEHNPHWLADIDEYFSPGQPGKIAKLFNLKPKRGQKFKKIHQFCGVVQLITPLVYFDYILKMNSFNDAFISELELAFMTRINIPRDVTEGKRFYNAILELPKERHYTFFDKPKVSPQPFLAQMMFVALLMRKAVKDTELWRFQYDTLKSCPDYLLDYPPEPTDPQSFDPGLSERPAFLVAVFVEDPDFRHCLISKNNNTLNRHLNDVMGTESSAKEAEDIVASHESPAGESLLKRVPDSQQELAQLLLQFEKLLEKDYNDVYRNLRPPVNDDQIENLNQFLSPLKIPEELATLYKWHDGIDNNSILFDYPDFLPMQGALFQYMETCKMGAELSWTKAWFTLGYENQEYWIIPLSEKMSEEAFVMRHNIVDGILYIYHSSIKDMIKSYIDLYQQGGVTFDKSDSFREINQELNETLRLQYSPDSYSGPHKTDTFYDINQPNTWPAHWKKYRISE